MSTTPADIAAYLWSVLAAERLKLIGTEECRSRLQRTLSTLASMERHNGFYLNDLDPRTGATLRISPFDASPRRPLVSSVDNAWLATALVMVINVEPTLRSEASKVLEAMDFRFFYDPYNSVDPIEHPGQLHVGYCFTERCPSRWELRNKSPMARHASTWTSRSTRVPTRTGGCASYRAGAAACSRRSWSLYSFPRAFGPREAGG